MIPLILRIELIVLALFFIAFVINKVNKRKLQMQYSLVWLSLSVGLIIIALFPNLVGVLAYLGGIEASSNLVYLVAIVVLLFILINMTVKLSKQAADIKTMVQISAIHVFLEEQKNDEK